MLSQKWWWCYSAVLQGDVAPKQTRLELESGVDRPSSLKMAIEQDEVELGLPGLPGTHTGPVVEDVGSCVAPTEPQGEYWFLASCVRLILLLVPFADHLAAASQASML